MRPPWSSNYTININTEMNYWGAEVAALPELHEPLFDLMGELAVAGRRTAAELYESVHGFPQARYLADGVVDPAFAFAEEH